MLEQLVRDELAERVRDRVLLGVVTVVPEEHGLRVQAHEGDEPVLRVVGGEIRERSDRVPAVVGDVRLGLPAVADGDCIRWRAACALAVERHASATCAGYVVRGRLGGGWRRVCGRLLRLADRRAGPAAEKGEGAAGDDGKAQETDEVLAEAEGLREGGPENEDVDGGEEQSTEDAANEFHVGSGGLVAMCRTAVRQPRLNLGSILRYAGASCPLWRQRCAAAMPRPRGGSLAAAFRGSRGAPCPPGEHDPGPFRGAVAQ